eukprot:13553991-Alexandrium_andersonii.AAC.1
MSASLVGSEMCIRDSPHSAPVLFLSGSPSLQNNTESALPRLEWRPGGGGHEATEVVAMDIWEHCDAEMVMRVEPRGGTPMD